MSRSFDSKLVLLGDSGVGKTSLVLRYVQGTYGEQQSTIGASFMTKKIILDDWTVKLQIWDTAGQERFRSMAPMYYRGAGAAVLVYDITSAESFDKVQLWVRELQNNLKNDIVLGIAANKCDMESKMVVPFEKAQAYANEIGALLFKTSAKESKGVDDLFEAITNRLIEVQKSRKMEPSTGGRGGSVDMAAGNKKSDKSCCS